jgi:hypothetical protein
MTDETRGYEAPGANGEAPRFAYAVDTLLIEVGRLGRVIRRLEESPFVSAEEGSERSRTLTRITMRIVELYDAITVLGELEGSDDLPDEE